MSRAPGRWHSMRLPRTDTAPARARDFMRDVLSADGAPQLVDDVDLAVSELVTNAIVHGAGAVTLECHVEPGALFVSVTDCGREVLDLQRTPRPTDEHGRGLRLVAAVADQWGVEGTGAGTRAWCRISERRDRQVH